MLLLNWLTRFKDLLRSANQRRSLRRRERRCSLNSHVELLESRTVLDGQPIVSIADAVANEDAGTIAFMVSVDWTPVVAGTFSGNLTVMYSTAGGSATSGTDF